MIVSTNIARKYLNRVKAIPIGSIYSQRTKLMEMKSVKMI